MNHARSLSRAILLALSMLSACAASGLPGGSVTEARTHHPARAAEPGAAAAFLVGRFAASEGDNERAADELLRALALDPDNPEVRRQAFLASLLAGRPEAVRLAHDEQDNEAAQLLLADQEAKAGNWDAAERRFAAMPKLGLVETLQPLLVAWAQFGGGRTDAALATLRPFVESERFRAVYAFHAALIADLANRPADAAHFFEIARDRSRLPSPRPVRAISKKCAASAGRLARSAIRAAWKA